MKTITLENIADTSQTILIDVRSEAEFLKGHIPNSIHIPLLADFEREEVGKIYKTIGSEAAKARGLELTAVKLPEIVQEIKNLLKPGYNKAVVYCWRGGLRSKTVVTILELMSVNAFQLIGGYKAYRAQVLEQLTNFQLKPQIVVLCGSTGVGKTELLENLAQKGVPIINLEALAKHRGSVFGHIGLGRTETAQNFDSLILEKLQKLNDCAYIIVECESKRIGNIYIPDVLHNAMKAGIKILLSSNIETRITRLISEYTKLDKENYEAAIICINILEKRIGRTKAQNMLSDLKAGKIRDVVRSLLIEYYDPLYGYENSSRQNYNFHVIAEDILTAEEKIIKFLDNLRK